MAVLKIEAEEISTGDRLIVREDDKWKVFRVCEIQQVGWAMHIVYVRKRGTFGHIRCKASTRMRIRV